MGTQRMALTPPHAVLAPCPDPQAKVANAEADAATTVKSKLAGVTAQLEELHALREGVLGDLVGAGWGGGVKVGGGLGCNKCLPFARTTPGALDAMHVCKARKQHPRVPYILSLRPGLLFACLTYLHRIQGVAPCHARMHITCRHACSRRMPLCAVGDAAGDLQRQGADPDGTAGARQGDQHRPQGTVLEERPYGALCRKRWALRVHCSLRPWRRWRHCSARAWMQHGAEAHRPGRRVGIRAGRVWKAPA